MTPRVLVVDDERAIQLALRGVLRREGYDVEMVGSGDEALAKVRASTFDLVLTDLVLGRGPSGMDVLREVKRTIPDAVVVMITAHGSEKVAVEAMKLGAED
ncbi:MAG: response regulator, partial [Myxococcota bacterium]